MYDNKNLQFINSTRSRLLLVVEPRSSEFWIESGSTVRLHLKEPANVATLEIEYLAGGLVVYAGEADQVEVYQNGRRMAQDTRTRRMAKKLVS